MGKLYYQKVSLENVARADLIVVAIAPPTTGPRRKQGSFKVVETLRN
jgi:hypothetical protein